MSQRDIVFIAGIEWEGQNVMPCHHLVAQLAKRHRVFYIDNFGAVRDLTIHDASRCVAKLSRSLTSKKTGQYVSRRVVRGVEVWQPWVIPTPRGRCICKLNAWLLRRSLLQMYREYDISDPILWTRAPTELVWDAIQGLPYSTLVYQSIDKFPNHPRISLSLRPRFNESERKFNEFADVVFTSARGLWEEKRVLNKNTHFLPNGVSSNFANSPEIKVDTMEKISGPVVGFAGALGTATDIEFIVKLVKELPDVTFVFLGTIDRTEPLRGLDRLSNVILQGLVPHHELISWFRYFDVGLMPYKINRFQDYTFPSKLAEYLMAGLPIVSTRLPELMHYEEVVKISDDAATMASDIRKILETESRVDETLLKARRKIAEGLTWESQAERVEKVLEKLLLQ